MAQPPIRKLGIREFRDTFTTLNEPVDVYRSRGKLEKIGRYIPVKSRKEETEGLNA